MSKYRDVLPLTNGSLFVTDGGIETSLIFNDGIDLPYFAAFDLLKTEEGRESLRRYFSKYAEIARARKLGFVLESPTWRASADWGHKLGYSAEALAEANRDGIRLMEEIRDAYETPRSPMVISGCIGPRGDGYDPGQVMTVEEATRFHSGQARVFAETAADLITAITMTNVNEATGVARAAADVDMPAVISFTVETDGKLPTGQELGDAIDQVDDATGGHPLYYMINCAHPTHFRTLFGSGGSWVARVRGLRANASRRSHAELNEASDLDDGDPLELGGQYAELRQLHPEFVVFGGCCGTDHRHVDAIAHACGPHMAAA